MARRGQCSPTRVHGLSADPVPDPSRFSAAIDGAEGAGLGLYITERLAEAMGGRIEVSSVVGSGSTFTVRLSITRPTAPSRPSAAAQAG